MTRLGPELVPQRRVALDVAVLRDQLAQGGRDAGSVQLDVPAEQARPVHVAALDGEDQVPVADDAVLRLRDAWTIPNAKAAEIDGYTNHEIID